VRAITGRAGVWVWAWRGEIGDGGEQADGRASLKFCHLAPLMVGVATNANDGWTSGHDERSFS